MSFGSFCYLGTVRRWTRHDVSRRRKISLLRKHTVRNKRRYYLWRACVLTGKIIAYIALRRACVRALVYVHVHVCVSIYHVIVGICRERQCTCSPNRVRPRFTESFLFSSFFPSVARRNYRWVFSWTSADYLPS